MANRVTEYAVRIIDQATANLNRIRQGAGMAENSMSRLVKTARNVTVALGLAFGVSQLQSFGMDAIQTSARVEGLQNAIVFASGSAQEGAKNLQFLSDISERLGLNQLAATEGFRTLSGALMRTGITADQTRSIFSNVSTAVRGAQLSADDAKGVYLALGQIMSKGKVSAEELRGQIGERIPGAFNIAARAMGLTTAELDKMMQKGDLASKDFIIPFSQELQKQFAGALPKAVQSLGANLERINNDLLNLKTSFVNEFTPEIQSAVRVLRENFVPALKLGFGYLRTAVKFIRDNAEGLKALAFGVGVAALAYGRLTIAAKLNAFWMGTSTLSFYAHAIAANGLSGAWAVLNSVMLANPIGLAIAAIAGFSAIIFYAWNNVEWFRGALIGLWYAIKVVAQGIWNIIAGLHTFDLDRVKRGFTALGNDAGKAFKVGYESVAIEAYNKKSKQIGDDRRAARRASGLGLEFPENGMASIGKKGDDKTKKDLGKINDGGRRQTVVNVTIGKLVEQLVFNSNSLKEGASEVQDNFTELLIRALNGSVTSLNQ